MLLQERGEKKERIRKQCMMADRRHSCVSQLPKVAGVIQNGVMLLLARQTTKKKNACNTSAKKSDAMGTLLKCY